jgi:hypothetical protein
MAFNLSFLQPDSSHKKDLRLTGGGSVLNQASSVETKDENHARDFPRQKDQQVYPMHIQVQNVKPFSV